MSRSPALDTRFRGYDRSAQQRELGSFALTLFVRVQVHAASGASPSTRCWAAW